MANGVSAGYRVVKAKSSTHSSFDSGRNAMLLGVNEGIDGSTFRSEYVASDLTLGTSDCSFVVTRTFAGGRVRTGVENAAIGRAGDGLDSFVGVKVT